MLKANTAPNSTQAVAIFNIMEMRAACWSIGSAYESLTVDDAKTIKSRPSPASQFVLMNYIL